MKKLQIEKLLTEIENKLEYLKTPRLRADTVLSLLRVEHANHKNIDLFKGAQQGLDAMLGEMDKVEQLSEIDIAIKILVHYLESNSFSLTVIPHSNADIIMVNLFDELNNRLEKIVTKYDNETAQFLP